MKIIRLNSNFVIFALIIIEVLSEEITTYCVNQKNMRLFSKVKKWLKKHFIHTYTHRAICYIPICF